MTARLSVTVKRAEVNLHPLLQSRFQSDVLVRVRLVLGRRPPGLGVPDDLVHGHFGQDDELGGVAVDGDGEVAEAGVRIELKTGIEAKSRSTVT